MRPEGIMVFSPSYAVIVDKNTNLHGPTTKNEHNGMLDTKPHSFGALLLALIRNIKTLGYLHGLKIVLGLEIFVETYYEK